MPLIRLLKNSFQQFRNRLQPLITRIKQVTWPSFVWRMNLWFVWVLLALSGATIGIIILRTGWSMVVDGLIGAAISCGLFFLTWKGLQLIALIVRKTIHKRTAFVIAAIIGFTFVVFGSLENNWLLGLAFVSLIVGLSTVIAWLVNSDFFRLTLFRKVLILAGLIISLGGIAASFIWLFHSGTNEGVLKVKLEGYPQVTNLELENPADVGEFKVDYLTYGSGADRRAAFADSISIQTDSVNAKPFVKEMNGKLKYFRKLYFGFDRTEWPLNGRVWYPQGEGPFPLVLVVHGNHSMRDYSDPGYEYLGRLLASRGYITVSVDENFLNGDWAAYYNNENDARGWLLLEHLKRWKNWNADVKNPFFEKVDMDNIALIGHSRGGEAVAIAASFNTLTNYPDDARVTFDYNFNIKSVIAIAPIDGQYKPSKVSTPLENINYLVLQGSHDADVSYFSGDRQYKRIKFTDDNFYIKTSIYAYRANHGQFNSVWGNRDFGLPYGLILNVKPLISGEDQRQISKVYISAFLDATIRGESTYLPLFRDYRKGSDWLPETYFISRYEDANTKVLIDFEEDVDVTTTKQEGGSISGHQLATWREADLGFRNGRTERQNKVVILGWDYSLDKADSCSSEMDTIARYHIQFAKNVIEECDSVSLLTFAMAELDEKPQKPLDLDEKKEEPNENEPDDEEVKEDNDDRPKKSDKKDEDKEREPLWFTVSLNDSLGHEVSLSLKELMPLMPPFKAKFTRRKQLETNYKKASEPILQTFEIPIDSIVELNPNFKIRQLSSFTLVFDGSEKGVIALDEIGVR